MASSLRGVVTSVPDILLCRRLKITHPIPNNRVSAYWHKSNYRSVIQCHANNVDVVKYSSLLHGHINQFGDLIARS